MEKILMISCSPFADRFFLIHINRVVERPAKKAVWKLFTFIIRIHIAGIAKY
jgi:hypothetical protein